MTRRVAASGRISTDCILLAAAIAATIFFLLSTLKPGSFTIRALEHAAGEPLPSRVLFWQNLDQTVLAAARNSGQENFVADLVVALQPRRGRSVLRARDLRPLATANVHHRSLRRDQQRR
jgi:hypothetical protein